MIVYINIILVWQGAGKFCYCDEDNCNNGDYPTK